MATKRRKVWANWYPALGEAPSYWGTRLGTKSDARMAAQPGAEMVSLIERLPGDVVRTKNEEVALESAIDRYTEAWETAYATHTDEARRAVTACGRNLRALLRGRR